MNPQFAALQSRASAWLSSVTLVFKVLAGVLVALFVPTLLFASLNQAWCFNPQYFLRLGHYHLCASQIYVNYLVVSLMVSVDVCNPSVFTWFTSGLIHYSVMHILFNMMSFAALGPWFERRVGSVQALWSYALFQLLLVSIAFLIYIPLDKYDANASNVCIGGFSGVLFTLMTIEAYSADGGTHRSLWGLIQVPKKVWPWVALGLAQLFLPQVSFIGHLSGIIVGLGYTYGVIARLALPDSFIAKLETTAFFVQFINNREGFVPNPGASSAHVPASPLPLCGGR